MLAPEKLALRAKPIAFWIIVLLVIAYFCVCIVFFVAWMNPSLQGETSLHIAADSSAYIFMADVLREHRPEPWVYASLAHFPNTLWMPVAIAYVLNSTVLTVIFNLALLVLSIALMRRAVPLDSAQLVLILLLNPTTVVSLLSVNKEIVDMLVVALFCCYLSTRRKGCLWSALLLALLNRYEVLICLVLFLVMRSRLNPWRRRRWLSLAFLVSGMSILLPLVALHALAERFAEAQGGGMVAILDQLEMHFLFAVAAVPKIGENLFGELLNPAKIPRYELNDLANSYILLLNNIATAFVFVRLWMRGRLRINSIQSDLIYLSAVTSLVMSISLVIQPRYFYLVYVLLCVEAVRRQQSVRQVSRPLSGELAVPQES